MATVEKGRPMDEIKNLLGRQVKEEAQFHENKKEIVCKRCKEVQDPETMTYYKCQKHKIIFCKDCLLNNVKGIDGIRRKTTDWRNCTHCVHLYHLGQFNNDRYYTPGLDDCIYTRLGAVPDEIPGIQISKDGGALFNDN
jgi:hypothetical protein